MAAAAKVLVCRIGGELDSNDTSVLPIKIAMHSRFRTFLLVLSILVFAACEEKSEQEVAGANQWVTMLSQESASSMTLPEATQYCSQLSESCEYKLDRSTCDAAVSETGWRVPSQADLSLFLGVTQTSNNLWTRSANPAVQNTYMFLKISDGSWGYDYAYSPYIYVRCVK